METYLYDVEVCDEKRQLIQTLNHKIPTDTLDFGG